LSLSLWGVSQQLLGYPTGWGGVSRRGRKRRLLKRHAKGWTKFSLVLCLLLLPGCVVETFSAVSGVGSAASAYFDWKTAEQGEPVIVTPPVAEYTSDIMEKAAQELEFMKPPCPRDHAHENCSALTRMILDYGDLRAKIDVAASPD
jgi:hypothetical protein